MTARPSATLMHPAIEKTERGFAVYMAENLATFAALQKCYPDAYQTLVDLAKASFYAGACFARKCERGEVEALEPTEATP